MKSIKNTPKYELSDETKLLMRKLDNKVNDLNNVCITVSLDWTIIDVNNAAVRQLGFESKQQILGRPLINSIYETSSRKKMRALTEELRAEENIKNQVINIVTCRGEVLKALVTTDTIYDEENHAICRIIKHTIVLGKGNNQSKEREAKLDRTNAHDDTRHRLKIIEHLSLLDGVIEHCPFAISITDPLGIVVKTNGKFREYINKSDSEIVNKYNIFKDKNLIDNKVMQEVKSVFETLKPVRINVAFKDLGIDSSEIKGKRFKWIHIYIYPILCEEGKLNHVVFQWIDISDSDNKDKEPGDSKILKENIHRMGRAIILH